MTWWIAGLLAGSAAWLIGLVAGGVWRLAPATRHQERLVAIAWAVHAAAGLGVAALVATTQETDIVQAILIGGILGAVTGLFTQLYALALGVHRRHAMAAVAYAIVTLTLTGWLTGLLLS